MCSITFPGTEVRLTGLQFSTLSCLLFLKTGVPSAFSSPQEPAFKDNGGGLTMALASSLGTCGCIPSDLINLHRYNLFKFKFANLIPSSTASGMDFLAFAGIADSLQLLLATTVLTFCMHSASQGLLLLSIPSIPCVKRRYGAGQGQKAFVFSPFSVFSTIGLPLPQGPSSPLLAASEQNVNLLFNSKWWEM